MNDFITEEALNDFINDYCKEQYAYWKYGLPICGIITSTDLSEKRSQVYSEIRAEDN